MIDIRNIDFDYINSDCTEDNHYNQIFINDYLTSDNINSYDEISNNKYEEYYIFQTIFDKKEHFNEFYLRYSRNKESFIVGCLNAFSENLMMFFGNNL